MIDNNINIDNNANCGQVLCAAAQGGQDSVEYLTVNICP